MICLGTRMWKIQENYLITKNIYKYTTVPFLILYRSDVLFSTLSRRDRSAESGTLLDE